MKTALKSYSILYAEDDMALQKNTAEYLHRYFKEVHVASDGAEALSLYNTCQADVLILDIDMPYLDGLSVASQIRKSDQTIPIVMMTAFTDTQMLLEATELNLTTYLVKPVKASQFQEALQKVRVKLENTTKSKQKLAEEYIWDSLKKVLYFQGEAVALSLKEKRLLHLLVEHTHHCVSFEEIMAVVWEDALEKEVSLESVKYHVSMLRKKLPNISIKNVYGKGYVLNI